MDLLILNSIPLTIEATTLFTFLIKCCSCTFTFNDLCARWLWFLCTNIFQTLIQLKYSVFLVFWLKWLTSHFPHYILYYILLSRPCPLTRSDWILWYISESLLSHFISLDTLHTILSAKLLICFVNNWVQSINPWHLKNHSLLTWNGPVLNNLYFYFLFAICTTILQHQHFFPIPSILFNDL